MRKRMARNGISMALAAVMGMAVMTGCGSSTAEVTAIPEEQVALKAEPKAEETAVEETNTNEYFIKGVYANYATELENPEKTYFYVFEGNGCGHVEDGVANTGMFFEYSQGDGYVNFLFGSEDPIEDELTIKSYENGLVIGSFEDTIDLTFELLADADPDDFNAVNYVNATKGEDYLYSNANGWTIKYDPDRFVINEGGPVTTIVYVGECAGTNMITATYTVDKNAQEAIKELGENYGDVEPYYSEGPFPGTEDVKGYWVSISPDTEGSGAYMTAMARDYMDGALIFEITGHIGNDEDNNMEVSDYLSAVIDSLQFPNENK